MIRTYHKKHREFKQKIKITIDNSHKFYLQKNDVIYTTAYQLSSCHNQTSKVASNMQRFACSSSFIPCENQRELLTSRVVCAVNRYKCFMEQKLDKNILRLQTFQINKIDHIKILLALIKKCVGSGLTPRYTEYQKVER